jgi:hypothetical protein
MPLPSENKLGSGDIPIYTEIGGNFTIPNSSMLLLCRDVLAKGYGFRLCAPGFSMTPFICNKDIITLEPCLVNSYSLGDVVGYARPDSGNFVVHRIVAIRVDGALIRGDNCSGPDGIIPFNVIVGRVCRVEHNGRNVRIGLGFERRIIASFSRRGILRTVVYPVWIICSLFRRIR